MMVGTVTTSVPEIMLMCNWVLEGDFVRKWERLKTNRIFWVLSSIFLFHLVGLLWTEDLGAGGDDVRTKMPLMFFPFLLFSSGPLSTKEYRLMLKFFVLGCVVNLSWCLFYSYVLHDDGTLRNVSRFMSHIRLGLYLNLAIAACVYFALNSNSTNGRVGFFAIAAFFLSGMLILGLATGLANFLLLAVAAGVVIIWKQKSVVRISATLALAILVAMTFIFFARIINDQLKPKNEIVNRPLAQNKAGNLYIHFDTLGQKENGYYVLMNIQLEELQRAWKRDFPADSFSYDHGHNLQRYEVLVRYMASKGMFKDSVGYRMLSESDKENVRNNVTNHLYPGWSRLHQRVYELVNEYDEFMNHRRLSGHSVSMRFYFWKAALLNIKQRPFAGAGTGDVQTVMNSVYKQEIPQLEKEWYKRPHNQFLTVGVALGIPVMIWFIFSVLYPAFKLGRKLSYLYWVFLLLAVFSFLVEDTLETQAGHTFYAFFNTFFVSYAAHRNEEV
jgi:hypothetical protein